MKYTSTRDATRLYTFEEALFSGYAPDGGLFVPVELPTFFCSSSSSSSSSLGSSNNKTTTTSSKNQVLTETWPKLGYTDLATEILHPFIGTEGIPKDHLRSLLRRALAGFDVPDTNLVPVVPMIQTTDGAGDNKVDCYVAELFHGPTYCFKDLGMRATVFLLEYFASKHNRTNSSSSSSSSNDASPTTKKVVLTASTTGDTGPAAVQAVQELDSPYLGIVVHYPEGQISDFQRKQMTTVVSERVEIVSFEGGGDDMDRPIKNIMTTKSHNSSSSNALVCGVNSYNIGRPLMQMVHFVWTYLRVVEDIEKRTNQKINHDNFRLDVVIPTGAMGNIAGCYMAKKLGVPFGNLCAGVNPNDITHRAFSTGIVRKPRSGEPMKPSLSDAINIQLPYNLERLLFYLTNQSHSKVKEWYDRLESNENGGGSIDLTKSDSETTSTPNWLEQLQSEFRSEKVTDSDLCDTMNHVLETYGYWIDPHTGVAFGAAEKLGYLPSKEDINSSDSSNHTTASQAMAIMATASPCKFQKAMIEALGVDKWNEYELNRFPPRGKNLRDMDEMPPTRYLADPKKTLEQNQVEWEEKTRELIAKLGR